MAQTDDFILSAVQLTASLSLPFLSLVAVTIATSPGEMPAGGSIAQLFLAQKIAEAIALPSPCVCGHFVAKLTILSSDIICKRRCRLNV